MIINSINKISKYIVLYDTNNYIINNYESLNHLIFLKL